MRTWEKALMLGASMLCLGFGISAQSGKGDPVQSSASLTVAETDAGKIQGFVRNGIYTFRGVPYAAAERFAAPQKVAAWQGVRNAMNYGNICLVPASSDVPGDDFFNPHRYWPESENCQYVNVWTPAIKDGKKRPVMVWLHGGGWTNGSSVEQYAYDGENLSRKGDVVVVTLNHRLNILGYLDLSAYGDKYKYSGDAGVMDLVAALQWVKANIAEFGGDPSNVTIFGQSGGGGKVLTLMATPAAKGLFAKAIVQSGAYYGGGITLTDRKASRKIAEYTLQNLGIAPADVDKIKTVPYDQLVAAGNAAIAKTAEDLGIKGFPGLAWAPVMDGDYIPANPADPELSALSKDIPLMIGNVLNEFSTVVGVDSMALEANNKNSWTDAQAKAELAKRYGAKADAVAKAFLAAYPDKKLADACFFDGFFRPGTIKVENLKARQGGAPVYSYILAWESPIMDGIAMAWHCSEIPLVFNNVALTETANGGGKAALALSDKMSQAWISFARTGNPSNSKLPAWPAYTADKGATMIFDNKCVVRNNPDEQLMSLFAQ
jgi:para-nitrobenzyl esterase